MSEKPEALRLAEMLDYIRFSLGGDCGRAAAELRRQHAEIERLSAEVERLRAFAIDIMEAWPDGGIDGADLQDIAEKRGMLSPVTVTAPCSEECNCAGYGLTPAEWASGHVCYRKTALLKGAAREGEA